MSKKRDYPVDMEEFRRWLRNVRMGISKHKGPELSEARGKQLYRLFFSIPQAIEHVCRLPEVKQARLF